MNVTIIKDNLFDNTKDTLILFVIIFRFVYFNGKCQIIWQKYNFKPDKSLKSYDKDDPVKSFVSCTN